MKNQMIEDSFNRYLQNDDVIKNEAKVKAFVWYKNGNLEIFLDDFYDNHLIALKFLVVHKLSGVTRYQLVSARPYKRRTSRSARAANLHWYSDWLKYWSHLYKPAERFVGGVVDGREQGVMIVHPFTEESEE